MLVLTVLGSAVSAKITNYPPRKERGESTHGLFESNGKQTVISTRNNYPYKTFPT